MRSFAATCWRRRAVGITVALATVALTATLASAGSGEARSLTFVTECGSTVATLSFDGARSDAMYGAKWSVGRLALVDHGRTALDVPLRDRSEPRSLRCRAHADRPADVEIDRYVAFEDYVWRNGYVRTPHGRAFPDRPAHRQLRATLGFVDARVTQIGYTDGAYAPTSSFPVRDAVRVTRFAVRHDLTPPRDDDGEIGEIRLVSLGPGAEATLFVHSDSGGNGCCPILTVYAYDRSSRTYRLVPFAEFISRKTLRFVTGNGGERLIPSRYFLVGTSFAGEAGRWTTPVRYFALRNGAFVDVTGEEDALVLGDAREAEAAFPFDPARCRRRIRR